MERYLDNYVPCAKRQCVEEEDILPNLEVNAVVYAYCQNVSGCSRTDDVPLYDSSVHGAPVYVGQTIQDITARDKQHLSNTTSPFDRHYTTRTQYTLVILCRRTFAPATSPSAFRDDTLRPVAEWMDFKEKHFISHFDTYHNGWNSTQGGQGRAWLVAIREANAKASAKRFETKYMPAFRDYHKEQGHVNVPQSHPVIGALVCCIRTGHTAIPPQYEDELIQMGLDLRNQMIVQRDEKWETEYMPAFRDFYRDNKHVNVPQSHPVLGRLVNNIRCGDTAIPPHYKDEFKERGFFWCTRNLARHVSRMLGRTVVSLDNDAAAMDAVTKAAAHHATLRALRSTLTKEERKVSGLTRRIPFGNKTIGDGVARFYADAASMEVELEGEERDVVKEACV
jgi:hypothetical protein